MFVLVDFDIKALFSIQKVAYGHNALYLGGINLERKYKKLPMGRGVRMHCIFIQLIPAGREEKKLWEESQHLSKQLFLTKFSIIFFAWLRLKSLSKMLAYHQACNLFRKLSSPVTCHIPHVTCQLWPFLEDPCEGRDCSRITYVIHSLVN